MSDLLSPEEIDALLNVVAAEEPGFGAPPGEVHELDLTNPVAQSSAQLPPLDHVNQVLTRRFADRLRPVLDAGTVVDCDSPYVSSYADYIATLERPTSLQLLQVAEFDDNVLLALSAALVINYVDFYYGGDGSEDDTQRDFTVTETRVASGLGAEIAAQMTTAWESITPLTIEPAATESTPAFARFFSAGDAMVVSRFTVMIGERDIGTLDALIPRSALEPFHQKLVAAGQGDQDQKQSRWKAVFQDQVRHACVELNSTLATTRISLGQLVTLKPGDILPFEMPPEVELSAGSVPLFRGMFGVHNDYNAVRINKRLT